MSYVKIAGNENDRPSSLFLSSQYISIRIRLPQSDRLDSNSLHFLLKPYQDGESKDLALQLLHSLILDNSRLRCVWHLLDSRDGESEEGSLARLESALKIFERLVSFGLFVS